MACTNCKQNGKTKEEIREELITSSKVIGKVAIWISVIWMALGVYGLITLIGKFL
jgi:hypothetical protein